METYKKPDQDTDLFQLVGMLWRGKWWILLSMFLFGLLALIYLTQVVVPKYTASAIVALQSRNENVVDFENVLSGLSGDQASINTEVEVLRARALLDKLVAQLQLTDDPEFNRTLKPKTIWSLPVILRSVRETILGPQPEPVPSARKIRDDTTDTLMKKLAVSNIRRSFAFQISVTTEDPEKSALIADTLADIYISEQINAKFTANERATSWLADQLSDLRTDLEVSENAVKEFDTITDLVSPEALGLRNRQLKEFRELTAQLSIDQANEELRLAALASARQSGDRAAMDATADDPLLTAAYRTLNGGGERARETFDQRYASVIAETQARLNRIKGQIVTVQKSITELEGIVAEQSSELLRMQQLEREANANRLVYEYFLSRQKEILAQRGIHTADSRVLSHAVVPDKPSSPRVVVLSGVAALLGMLIASGLVLLREMRNSAFRTPEDLEGTTGLPVMGEIVKGPQSKRRRILEYIATKPNSALVEAVRNLRTSILLSSAGENPQVIMLTSSMPGEGKTTQSLALAHNLASMNKSVLMIDADIRRRTLREYFSTKEERGLFAVVANKAKVGEVVFKSDLLGVDILFCEEKHQVDAAQFFSSDAYRDFLVDMRKAYDYVIIDTPPVMAVPDARVIGQTADVTLYVVKWDETPRRQVQQGLRSFSTVNVPINGLVLNQIDMRKMRGYGEGYSIRAEGYYDRT